MIVDDKYGLLFVWVYERFSICLWDIFKYVFNKDEWENIVYYLFLFVVDYVDIIEIKFRVK